MPSEIVLEDCLNQQKKLYFLIKEEDFPIEAVQLIQNQLDVFTSYKKSYTQKDLIEIAEDIIEQYNGTLIPFKLYKVSFNRRHKN